MSLAAVENARLTPGLMALADERGQLNWAELDLVLNRATNTLIASHLGEARAAVFANNAVETCVAYLAALHAGISSVPVNFHLTAEETAYILTHSGARVVFVGPETAGVGLRAATLAGLETVIGWRCPPLPGLISWEAWLAEASAAELPGHMAPRPHLHYTSGTTGQPKGVETPPTMFPRVETNADLVATLRDQFAAGGARSPALLVSPLYHTGPLSSVRALAGGCALVTAARFDPEDVLRTIERYGIQTTLMVPTHFQRLLALPDEVRAKYDISSLQVLGHTGASCPREVKRRMIEWFGPVLVEAYGATEAGTTNRITSEEWLERPGSVGQTQLPFELEIIAEDGERLGANQVGQLYFRDTTGRGVIYHDDPAKTLAAHLKHGLFTLGEVGYVDDDGYVFITDRVSDMIVSGGVNIYPAETERVLIEHPAVADVAVVGAPNAEMGEEVRALIIPRDPHRPPSFADLDAFCRARLAGFKCPRAYDIVGDIGRNALGKINKRELRRKLWPTERTIGG